MVHYRVISDRLRKLRGDLSQKEFASKLGISFGAYQNYEAGKRLPKGKILERIAKAVGSSVDGLFTGVEQPDFVKEAESLCREPMMRKVLDLMLEMDTEGKRDVLKYVEKEKVITDLRKKRKASGRSRVGK